MDAATAIPFIVLELLEGETLRQRLERHGKLGWAETSRCVLHITRALTRAHALGIVHRDLKPENVFLIGDGDEEIAKVLDFGIAKQDHSFFLPVHVEHLKVGLEWKPLRGLPAFEALLRSPEARRQL